MRYNMKKIFLMILITLTLLSISGVCADENITDVVASDGDVLNQMEDNLQETDSHDDADDTNVGKATSQITASNVKGYESFKTTVGIKLTANGTALASKPISILLDGVTYNKNTDKNGEVKLAVSLKKGEYNTVITYLGDNSTTNATKTCKISISSPSKTTLTVGDKYINYRQGSKCLFYVKLLSNGKAVKNQLVTFKIGSKTYTAYTDKNGVAKIYVNLKKGKHTVKYYFTKNAPYLSSSGSYKINVKAKMAQGDGYWLWSSHMKKVNLKSLSKKGTKHILLHVHAISQYGKSSVVSFIKKAHKYGMKVHLWMQVCYSGGKWVRPINKDNTIKYSFLNKKIKEAKKYAKIKGVDGIHFDYVRFGGTAHLYKDPDRAINYFSKKASTEIHKIKPNCIVSAALMPEPSMMHYYYGQDVSTMSKYMDVLIPMVYKGNYHQKTPWITSVTKAFVGQSNGAQIWTGLQSYHSDDNAKKLTQSSLLKDAKAAKNGGATGVMLFRIGISCNFNFKKV